MYERPREVGEPHEVRTMVTEGVETVTAGSDVTAEVSAPDDCWAWADDCSRAALRELVENALEHGDPPVSVTVTVDGDWVRTRVRDAGSGVPDHESAVVEGETDSTPLTHASGLGLWLAQSAAEANGGRLTFEAGSEGTVATLSHRRAATPAA